MRRPALAALLLGLTTVIAVCETCGQRVQVGPARAPSDSTLAQLSYPATLLGRERVTLRDGMWEGDSTFLGHESLSLVLSAQGELTAGRQGAAVVLFVDPGATGRFFDLVPVQTTAAGVHAGRATTLGDRVRPESLWVAEQRVYLRLVTHDTADGLCCPTRREVQRFRIVETDSLALERRELLERIPPNPGAA